MTGSEQREAARQFINRWRGKGKEDEDGRSYWIELLSNVFGVENVTERIDFEKKVVVDGNTMLFTLAGNSLMEVDSFLVLLARVRWNQILLFIRFI